MPFRCCKDCPRTSSTRSGAKRHRKKCDLYEAFVKKGESKRRLACEQKKKTKEVTDRSSQAKHTARHRIDSDHRSAAPAVSSTMGLGEPMLVEPTKLPPVRTTRNREVTMDLDSESRRDILPEPPIAIEPELHASPSTSRTSQIIQVAKKYFRTARNSLGLFREFLFQPSYDPDAFAQLNDFRSSSDCDYAYLTPPEPEGLTRDIQHVYTHANQTVSLLMEWQNSGSSKKSDGEVDRLVYEVLMHPQFRISDLEGFRAHRENIRCDKLNDSSPLRDGFKEGVVDIEVPSGDKNVPPRRFTITGLLHRNLLSTVKAAFSSPLASKFHYSPYKLFHKNERGEDERIYCELYDSDVFIEEHEKIQNAPLPPEDSDCTRERTIAALMFWSDATCLANFGTAKLWPIYMMLGNLSKYVRAQPSSGACQHLAYIPSLPDSFQDEVSHFHRKWKTQRKDILSHCRRELLHEVWRILIDDDFRRAYTYGLVLKCYDGIERRVYPRILIYSADYPEKVQIATIRDKGLCPCPRCLVLKSKLELMGQSRDLKFRINNTRIFLADIVDRARHAIYKLAAPINGTIVERLLKPTSSVPTTNAFYDTLGADFNISRMLAVDLMHEFELGIWKALFTHIIRLLYAASPSGTLVDELDRRFRQIPTFGSSTIRKFSSNASQMKKLAARDFEDLLQCAIPAFEGLLDEPHNNRLMKLLYRTAEWHAFAKLRLHTDTTLTHLDNLTKEFGLLMRQFRDITCKAFNTVELPKEAEARNRRNATSGVGTSGSSTRKPKTLNLSTYKWHSLGDFVHFIKLFGGTDSFSTQVGELAHRTVKRLYGLTNKRKAETQIAKRFLRIDRAEMSLRMRNIRNRMKRSRGALLEDGIPCYDLSSHYHIPTLRQHPIDLYNFVKSHSQWNNDPAVKNFIPKLQDHILGRLLKRDFDGDGYGDFHDDDRNHVRFINNKIFEVKTFRVNYTTYDIRRGQDVVNPDGHANVMVRGNRDSDAAQPYWYARVLGIFHARVTCSHPNINVSAGTDMSFLWVRWYGDEQKYTSGFRAARLPKVGFVPSTDPYAFGFLDPDLVIRACHLIPSFSNGRTGTLLDKKDSLARRSHESDDWVNYYVGIFVDRDMVIRHFGGGIGHASNSNAPTEEMNDDTIAQEEVETIDSTEAPPIIDGDVDTDFDDSDIDGEENMDYNRDEVSSESDDESSDSDGYASL